MASSNQDTKIEDLLQDVAKDLLEEWKFLGRKLGLSEGELDNIERDNRGAQGGAQEMKYQTLLHWKHKQGSQATIDSLAAALREVGRADLATKIDGKIAQPQQVTTPQPKPAKKRPGHIRIQSSAKVKGRHNLVIGNTSSGDVALYSDSCREYGVFLQRKEYTFQYHKRPADTITGVLVHDNWDDDTGGFPQRIAGGPGENCIEVKVTSRINRGMHFSFTVYGRKG